MLEESLLAKISSFELKLHQNMNLIKDILPSAVFPIALETTNIH